MTNVVEETPTPYFDEQLLQTAEAYLEQDVTTIGFLLHAQREFDNLRAQRTKLEDSQRRRGLLEAMSKRGGTTEASGPDKYLPAAADEDLIASYHMRLGHLVEDLLRQKNVLDGVQSESLRLIDYLLEHAIQLSCIFILQPEAFRLTKEKDLHITLSCTNFPPPYSYTLVRPASATNASRVNDTNVAVSQSLINDDESWIDRKKRRRAISTNANGSEETSSAQISRSIFSRESKFSLNRCAKNVLVPEDVVGSFRIAEQRPKHCTGKKRVKEECPEISAGVHNSYTSASFYLQLTLDDVVFSENRTANRFNSRPALAQDYVVLFDAIVQISNDAAGKFETKPVHIQISSTPLKITSNSSYNEVACLAALWSEMKLRPSEFTTWSTTANHLHQLLQLSEAPVRLIDDLHTLAEMTDGTCENFSAFLVRFGRLGTRERKKICFAFEDEWERHKVEFSMRATDAQNALMATLENADESLRSAAAEQVTREFIRRFKEHTVESASQGGMHHVELLRFETRQFICRLGSSSIIVSQEVQVHMFASRLLDLARSSLDDLRTTAGRQTVVRLPEAVETFCELLRQPSVIKLCEDIQIAVMAQHKSIYYEYLKARTAFLPEEAFEANIKRAGKHVPPELRHKNPNPNRYNSAMSKVAMTSSSQPLSFLDQNVGPWRDQESPSRMLATGIRFGLDIGAVLFEAYDGGEVRQCNFGCFKLYFFDFQPTDADAHFDFDVVVVEIDSLASCYSPLRHYFGSAPYVDQSSIRSLRSLVLLYRGVPEGLSVFLYNFIAYRPWFSVSESRIDALIVQNFPARIGVEQRFIYASSSALPATHRLRVDLVRIFPHDREMTARRGFLSFLSLIDASNAQFFGLTPTEVDDFDVNVTGERLRDALAGFTSVEGLFLPCLTFSAADFFALGRFEHLTQFRWERSEVNDGDQLYGFSKFLLDHAQTLAILSVSECKISAQTMRAIFELVIGWLPNLEHFMASGVESVPAVAIDCLKAALLAPNRHLRSLALSKCGFNFGQLAELVRLAGELNLKSLKCLSPGLSLNDVDADETAEAQRRALLNELRRLRQSGNGHCEVSI